MLDNLREKIRQVVRHLIGKSTIETALHIKTASTTEMVEAISLWSDMYQNAAPWLGPTVKSLNLPSAIASEIARLTTIELKSEITGSPRAEMLNSAYRKVLSNLRRFLEYGCAKGSLVLKPYIDGKEIAVDFVQADQFYPCTFDNAGNITAIVFVERIQNGDAYFTRLEHHSLTGTDYTIRNRAFRSNNKSGLGMEIPLSNVEAWATLEPSTTIQNVTKPLYGYFRVPIANTIDQTSPMGVSVFSRAVGLIKEADKQYSRLLWEYEGSELAIDASIDLFKHKDGKLILPKGKERLYRTYDVAADGSGDMGMKYFSPAIRDESLVNGLNRLYQRIEFNVGLAYGTISDPQNVDKTAEEIRTSKQRSYALITDMQSALQTALIDLIDAMDAWATLGDLTPRGKYDISFEWGDSVLVDTQSEQTIRMQEVSAGLIKPEHYLMWRYGISEEEALKRLPSTYEDE